MRLVRYSGTTRLEDAETRAAIPEPWELKSQRPVTSTPVGTEVGDLKITLTAPGYDGVLIESVELR